MREFRTLFSSKALRLVAAAVVAGLLAGCQADELGYGPKHLRSVNRETAAIMEKLGMAETSPVLMRIFKEESKFEVWKQDRTGRYQLLKSYDICKWSGKLGPKIKEGDRQAPEGYYAITPGLMNPNSQYYLAFNTGFPNAYDRANGRTGTALMVHGACSSRGCYAMTDEQIQEIYALARDAFRGGQKTFQLQAYPFKMTPENMARHWNDPNMAFWKMLKEGYDTFELTRQEPKVDVCGRKYVFNATPRGPMSPAAACPELVQPESLKVALAAKAKADEEKAVVLAARFDSERKAEEEQKILVAQRIEEEKQRAAEREIAARERGQAFASILGLGASGQPEIAAPAEPAAILPASGPDATASGEPLPKPAPRAPDTALAMVDQASPAGQGSMFTRLFSFGDDELPAPPAVEPAAAVSAVASAEPAATVAAAAPAAAPDTLPDAAPACAPAGSVAAAGTPVCPPALTAAPPVAAAAPPPEPGLLGKITGWF